MPPFSGRGKGDCLHIDYSQSPPLFFREIIEILRVFPLMAVILIFKCTEGAGIRGYSCRGIGEKNRETVITALQLAFTEKLTLYQRCRRLIGHLTIDVNLH